MILITGKIHTIILTLWIVSESGDAYVSGALYGYLKHGDCQKALEYGNAMAAIKHSVIGDMVFTDLEEIDSIIKQHKNTSGYQSE